MVAYCQLLMQVGQTARSQTRAGEPELEPGALEPSIFPGAGAGAFLNISSGAGAAKYLSAPVLSIANFNNLLS